MGVEQPDTARGPTVLLVFPADWLERRRAEWEPLCAAACAAGFDAVVADWDALTLDEDAVVVGDCLLRLPGMDGVEASARARIRPDVLLTTWGVDWDHRELFDGILRSCGSLHSEVPLLAWLDGKCELELCLREFEQESGRPVPRPFTRLSEELGAADGVPPERRVIVKPSRSGRCEGITIVPRAQLPELAQAVAAGERAPFVAQELVDDVFLYEGRRWDFRVHAIATSLAPLRWRLYREGIAKPTGAPATGDGGLREWLNADSFLRDERPADNVPLTEMLAYVERHHRPLPGFWDRLDAVVGDVFASLALWAERREIRLEGAFMLPGLDFIIERGGPDGYELRLLELNSHPGLAWGEGMERHLAPHYTALFADLRDLTAVAGGAG
jgi:hypothetical protein